MSDDNDSGTGTWVTGFIVLTVILLAASAAIHAILRLLEHIGAIT